MDAKENLKNKLRANVDPKKAIQEYLASLHSEVLEKFRRSNEFGSLSYNRGDLNRIIELQELFK